MTDWRGPTGGGDPTEAGVTDEAEVEELVEEIEATRGEMTGTVEEIGDRLDPRNIVADAKETVREATVGKVEDMANTAGEMVGSAGQTAQEAGTGLMDTIRRNPVPAAMVGIGLGWLAMSARSSESGEGWRPGQRYARYRERGEWTAGTMGREAWGAHPTSQQGVGQRAGQLGEAAGERVSQVQQTAGEAASQVQQTAGQMADRVSRTAGEMPYQVQGLAHRIGDNADRMFQENPLAMGAIAVAVGTAIGMALPSTPMERDVLAGPAGQAMGKAEDAATQALGKAEETVREAEQKARTPDTQAPTH